MGMYDRFFNSKGKGHTLLAVAYDPYQNCNLNVYYIGEDTNVGVVAEGITACICPIGNSLFSLFEKGELAALIEKAKAGEAIEVKPPVVGNKSDVKYEEAPRTRHQLTAADSTTIRKRAVLSNNKQQELPLKQTVIRHRLTTTEQAPVVRRKML